MLAPGDGQFTDRVCGRAERPDQNAKTKAIEQPDGNYPTSTTSPTLFFRRGPTKWVWHTDVVFRRHPEGKAEICGVSGGGASQRVGKGTGRNSKVVRGVEGLYFNCYMPEPCSWHITVCVLKHVHAPHRRYSARRQGQVG